MPLRRRAAVLAAWGLGLVLYLGEQEKELLSVIEKRGNATHALVSLLSVGGFEGHMAMPMYVASALRLGCSMRQHGLADGTRDWLLLVVDELRDLPPADREALELNGWRLVHVRCLPLWHHWSYLNNRYNNACMFSKLWLWAIEGYETIHYIDLDMLMVGDPTPFMAERGPLKMVPDKSVGFNAGLIVLSPNATVFRQMVDIIASTRSKHRELAEQTFLNEFMEGAIDPLPLNYTAEVSSVEWSTMPILLHFIGNDKPWYKDRCTAPEMRNACALWAATPLNGPQCTPTNKT